MKQADVESLARQLLDRHGLTGWRIEFDHARTRAGKCDHGRRIISLSKVLTALYDSEAVRDVILHEIAHALVGHEHGHDAVWKEQARRIGARPHRLLRPDLPRPSAPWVGTCPRGHRLSRYRRPTRVVTCARCSRQFDLTYLFTWEHHGEAASPGVSYERELARLKRGGGSLSARREGAPPIARAGGAP